MLVVDDGSPDDTYKVAKDKYKNFSNIEIKNRYKKRYRKCSSRSNIIC